MPKPAVAIHSQASQSTTWSVEITDRGRLATHTRITNVPRNESQR